MTVVWVGTFVIVLKQITRRLFHIDKYKHSAKKQMKRIGVYYMCIDDLPL